MRVLLDEMVPRKLGRELAGHTVATVPQQGWAGLANGRLLDAIESRFDVLVTMDKGMRHQQRLAERSFGVVELRAHGNDIDSLLPLVPALLAAISAVRPGEIVGVEDPGHYQRIDTLTPSLYGPPQVPVGVVRTSAGASHGLKMFAIRARAPQGMPPPESVIDDVQNREWTAKCS